MPPYNIEVVSPAGPGPSNGNAIIDSINTRNKFMGPSSSSPRRTAPMASTVRRAHADMPSSSSSGSWAQELFPHSHPRTTQQQSRQQPSYPAAPASLISGMGNSIVSASIHPHIRELVEKQQQREQQKQQQHQYHQFQHPKLKEMYNNQEHEQQSQDDVNVIRGLHMNHVLNDQQHQQYNDDFVSKHPLSAPLDSPMNQHQQQQQLSPRSYHKQQHLPLPANTVDDDGDYVIEGTFQNKGCVCQTADDVGYLFGCGTKPQDEVVYVYNTKAPNKPENDPLTAQANERNLWYHQGPTPGGDQNVNDVLFQIDKEYQAMQAHHEGNMGWNTRHGHEEFLRDPPPGAVPRYRVVQADDDDIHTKSSCSLSGIMDLFLPGKRRNKQTRGSHRAFCGMSPRRGVFGDYSNYPSDREARNNKRNRPRPVSMSISNEDEQTTSSFDKAFAKFGGPHKKFVKNASDGVNELQSQLKAMVKERAMNNKDSPKESRQEPSPPVSPKSSSDDDTMTDVGKKSSSKEVSRLRKEKESLDKAREELKLEREQHEQKQSLDQARNMLKLELLQEQKLAAQYGLAGVGAGGVGMVGSPTAMGMGVSPMVLSPLSAQTAMPATPMMVANPAMTVPSVTLQQPAMQQMNGMVMNGGMWQQQMNNGMNTGMSTGVMGTNNGTNGVLQQAEKILQQAHSVAPQSVAPHSVAPDARSVMDKSMYSMAGHSTMHKSIFSGVGNDGKFIDNVGVYPTSRHRVSPKKGSSRPSPPSGEEYTQSSQMLNDLKAKNEMIRQDILKMKNAAGNKNSPRSGGVNVAGSVRKAGQSASASRPFPRTSPPSSPKYGMHYDPVARAMQRSDEARSIASTSLKGQYQGYRASSSPRYSSRAQSRGHDRHQLQGRYGGDGRGGGYEYSPSQRQPPSPMRTTRRNDQDYYHV